MAATINKSVVKTISRACATHETAPLTELRSNKIKNLLCLFFITGLPGKPSHKMGFRSSVSQSGHPREGKHEGLVRRNDVLINGFIGISLA